MPFATVDQRALYYEVHGAEGDPTVLVHGSFVDHQSWDLVVPGLSQALQVVAYDRRGHGRSAPGPRLHPVADDAADLAGILESANLFPAHVIAHSYGGAVATHLAIHRPELVRSLAVHEPPFLGLLAENPATAVEAELLIGEVQDLKHLARTGQIEEAARRFVDSFSLEDGAWNRLANSVKQGFILNAPRWVEEFDDPEAMRPDRVGTRELPVPVLLTTGDQSPRVLRRITDALAVELPLARVQELADCGHVPHVTRPDLYVAVLTSFLLERNVPPA